MTKNNENDKNIWTVYIHRNKINNKCYIGITCNNIHRRWQNGSGYTHKENGKYHQPKFANAINKYGWDNFEHIVWESGLTKEDACKKERLLIKFFDTVDNGYNCYDGGETGRLGKPHSEETKKLLSDMMRGRRHTEEAKRKIIEAQTGRPCKEETKKKISEALKAGDWGKIYMGKNNHRARSVIQLSKNGDFIKEWDCISDVTRELGFPTSNISKCCKGKINSAYGYI